MLSRTIAFAAILFFAMLSPVCFACETATITFSGNLVSAIPPHGTPPPETNSFADQTAAAQHVSHLRVFDSLGQAHAVTALFFSTIDQMWSARLLIDAGEIGGVTGQPSLLAEVSFFFNPDGTLQGYGWYAAQLSWSNGARLNQTFKILSDFDLLTLRAAPTAPIIGQDGNPSGCTQYGTMDFDSDGADDLAIYRPQTGMWAILKSSVSNADLIWKQWGLPGDYPMPGDYDGDGRADLVVWRPTNGTWYFCWAFADYDCSHGNAVQFGLTGDRPIRADFDGDRSLDLAIYRPSLNMYFFLNYRTGQLEMRQWGLPGDIPLLAGNKR